MARRRIAAAVLLSSLLVLPAGAAAQDEPVHPAHVHEGSCPAPGEVVAPLADVSPEFPLEDGPGAAPLPVGSRGASGVQGSRTTVPLSLSDLVAVDHAIVVHASAQDLGTYLVCGDIGGRLVEETDLPIALHPVGGSGAWGVAVLRDGGDGSATVTVMLATDGPTASEPSPSPAASIPPTVEAVAVGAELWWAGFGITVGDAVLDPAAGTLSVDIRLRNEGTANRSSIELANQVSAVIDGQPTVLRLSGPPSFPAGLTTAVSLAARGLPAGVALADITLTFGGGDVRQASVALAAGAVGEFDAPRAVPVRGTVRVPGTARFTLIAARVLPAACAGKTDAITFRPIAPDQESIVLTVREVGLRRLGANVVAFITGPGGLTFPAAPGLTSIYARQTNPGRQWCFTVPAPAGGQYRVTFETSDAKGSRTIRVP